MNLRKAAKGRECKVWLPGCEGQSESVILAHFRLIGISGMGIKPPDPIASWCCASCHRVVDTDKSESVQLAFAKGCFRTQAELIREGILQW